MVTSATPPRRRATAAIGVEPTTDTTQTKVVLEKEGNDAIVTEQIGAKTVQYNAKVKENESTDETEDTEFETEFTDFNQFDEIPNTPQIPKTNLDRLFEDITFALETQDGLFDSFFAKIARQPDAMSDRFNVPCRELIDLGVIQFSTQDRFNFQSAIQESNGNSGGRFAISIFDSNYAPLTIYKGRALQPIGRDVGAILVIPNPQPKPTTDNNGAGMDAGLSAVLSKMVEINQSNHREIINALQRKPEKSTLELALEQKIINDILNPPNHNNGNTAADIVANIMQGVAVSTAIGDAMAKNINREPPPTPEPDWIDKVDKLSQNPMAQQLIGRIGDIGEAIAVSKMKLNETAPNATNGVDQNNNMAQAQPDETQELILEIIDEIESDNPLNADNETIKELAADYPEHYTDLVAMCQSGASFEFIFDQLIKKTNNMQPSPFYNYLDIEQTNAQGKFIWNEAGVRMKGRLLELYNYLKTI